jgi:hypothetical protein
VSQNYGSFKSWKPDVINNNKHRSFNVGVTFAAWSIPILYSPVQSSSTEHAETHKKCPDGPAFESRTDQSPCTFLQFPFTDTRKLKNGRNIGVDPGGYVVQRLFVRDRRSPASPATLPLGKRHILLLKVCLWWDHRVSFLGRLQENLLRTHSLHEFTNDQWETICRGIKNDFHFSDLDVTVVDVSFMLAIPCHKLSRLITNCIKEINNLLVLTRF